MSIADGPISDDAIASGGAPPSSPFIPAVQLTALGFNGVMGAYRGVIADKGAAPAPTFSRLNLRTINRGIASGTITGRAF